MRQSLLPEVGSPSSAGGIAFLGETAASPVEQLEVGIRISGHQLPHGRIILRRPSLDHPHMPL